MKKRGSEAGQQSVVQQLVIKTSDKDGSNVVNISLRVAPDGQITEMFGVDEKGKKWEVSRMKFTLKKRSARKKPEPEENDDEECKCCSHVPPPNGPIRCVTCSC